MAAPTLPKGNPASLPAFKPSGFKYTQAPNPEWTFAEPPTTTEIGRQWAEQEKLGWKTFLPAETDPQKGIFKEFYDAI
uniref:Uncharacterized protein n=1 Tax=Mycena chlorophos TaxID=658473 RepID=A0ABQ0L0E9_MYCCL|nr:predicted protein [Mycena chlorophos]